MALTDAWVWRPGNIEELDGCAGECLAPVCDLLEDQTVRVDELDRTIAWGQFLDSGHHSDQQWGRFGTSAALQVFAMAHHWDDQERSVYSTSPVNGVKGALPDEVPPANQGPKREDFDDPLKLAFMIDSLYLDEIDQRLPRENPPLVKHLLSLALPTNEGWSTRGTDDPRRQDRLLVTAFALHTLRRFPEALNAEEIVNAWDWLATQLRRRTSLLGADVLAMGCLALRCCPQSRQSKIVTESFDLVRQELVDRHGGERCPAIDRPYFNPYSRGEVNDYLFLSPELLTALFFLEEDDRPADVRAFSLEVVHRVVEQIRTENRDSSNPEGFRVQRGMLGTVDQMWAIRVLFAFHRAHRRNAAKLRPVGRFVFVSGLIAIPVTVALIFALYVFGGTPGAAAAGVLGAFLSVLLFPFVKRRD
jgi:hypothetical protein